MEHLRKTFQVSATLVVACAALMFAAAEGSALPAMTLPLALFALLVIDIPDHRGLPGMAALLLSLSALAASIAEFLLSGLEAQLLAPAHVLTYLTWIIILQKKNARQYWLLFGLSVLQVAVAALLTTDAWFGLALTVFFLLALWTLTVFTVQRAALRVDVSRRQGAPVDDGHHRAAAPSRASSSVRSVGQSDTGRPIINLRFAAGTFGTSLLSLILAGIFFLYTPRIWLGQLRLFDNSALATGLRPLTGFSEQVTLGDMGEILSNNELVLEIRLFDDETGDAIPPEHYGDRFGSDDPLFRGMTHEIYKDGNWLQLPNLQFDPVRNSRGARGTRAGSHVLRQEIRLQPNGSSILFCAGNALVCYPENRRNHIDVNRFTHVFQRSDDGPAATEFEYVVLSDPDSEGIPAGMPQHRDDWPLCRSLPPETTRVARLARRLVADHYGTEPVSDTEMAKFLTAYLRDSGEFSYSLSLEVEDPGVDPLEDFLFNRKSGHCEYFASALAIMLRAVGIHSRLVGGFKGGSYNPDSGCFEVRQLHAHSWVEAYLDDLWMPLDPTPPARDLSVAGLVIESTTGLNRWKQAWDDIWRKGVQLSKDEQQRLLYDPLYDTAADTWNALRDVRGSSARLGSFLRSLVASPERWFSWRGGVTAFVLLVILAALTGLLRRVTGLLRRGSRASLLARDTRPSIPFFDRFAKIVGRTGLVRTDVQTPLEFADEAQRQLARALVLPVTAGLPHDITHRYYAVRFGHHPISAQEIAALNQRLDALEHALGRAAEPVHD